MGFDGKWAIHPSQVPIANDVFSPTADEVAEARQAVATYREAEAGGVGAIGRDGKLVDAAHMRLAANTLHKARAGDRVRRVRCAVTQGRVSQGIGVPDGQRVRAASRPSVRMARERVDDLGVAP